MRRAYFVHSFSQKNAQTLDENRDDQRRAAAEEHEERPVVVPADAGTEERTVVVIARHAAVALFAVRRPRRSVNPASVAVLDQSHRPIHEDARHFRFFGPERDLQLVSSSSLRSRAVTIFGYSPGFLKAVAIIRARELDRAVAIICQFSSFRKSSTASIELATRVINRKLIQKFFFCFTLSNPNDLMKMLCSMG